jgi:NADH-quinone oxidoreductase subunit J
MTLELLLFYLFGGAMLASAIGVVTVRNPVHAVLLLILTFFNCALLWILLKAEFLGITLILVYVGAVMVLFLFVVMMLDLNMTPLREGFSRYLPVGALVAGVMAVEMIALLGARYFGAAQFAAPAAGGELLRDGSNTAAIGYLLFTEYVFPFEVASIILLVAMVAAIALTLRTRSGVRVQEPAKQSAVTKAERLRIVKVASQKQQKQEGGA